MCRHHDTLVHEIIQRRAAATTARPTGKKKKKVATNLKPWSDGCCYCFALLFQIRQSFRPFVKEPSVIIINNNWANEKLVFRPLGILFSSFQLQINKSIQHKHTQKTTMFLHFSQNHLWRVETVKKGKKRDSSCKLPPFFFLCKRHEVERKKNVH